MNTATRETSSPAVAGASLVELRGVSKRFVKPLDMAARIGNLVGAGMREEVVRAVDHVDLAIRPGEVVGLVGESGCGKSTLGRLAVGLLPPTRGERYWRGLPLSSLKGESARAQQLRMQMIFQDPYASLNPRMRVVDIVGEAPVAHGIIGTKQKIEYVGLQMNRVGLDPDADAPLSAPVLGRSAGAHRHCARARRETRVPGLRRVGRGARRVDPGAGAEPVHGPALGAQSHVPLHQPRPRRRRAHQRPRGDHVPGPRRRVGPRGAFFAAPNHPYTKALLAEVGKVVPRKRTFVPIKGEIPSPLDPPSGLPLPSAVPARDAAAAARRCRRCARSRRGACRRAI